MKGFLYVVVPLPFDFCKSSWWMQPYWPFVEKGSCLWPWVVYTIEVIGFMFLYPLLWLFFWLIYDVIYGSLRFVPVVTKIDVVSWGCSVITLRCVQRLHCVLLPCYTGLGSCSSGLSCLWLCLLNCFKCLFMLC